MVWGNFRVVWDHNGAVLVIFERFGVVGWFVVISGLIGGHLAMVWCHLIVVWDHLGVVWGHFGVF